MPDRPYWQPHKGTKTKFNGLHLQAIEVKLPEVVNIPKAHKQGIVAGTGPP